MSSWQKFFFGGGKCPNLGVVNVRILGVVNVRLANNLTPRNLPCFHNSQFRTHVQSIQQPAHDILCQFHLGLLRFPFSLPSMRALYIFSRHLPTRGTTILRRNCGAKYFLCIIFSFGVFYAYPFVLCGIFVRYLFCIIISFFDFDLIIYDFSSLFRVCSECARNVLRVDILHFQLCFFRNIKMF